MVCVLCRVSVGLETSLGFWKGLEKGGSEVRRLRLVVFAGPCISVYPCAVSAPAGGMRPAQGADEALIASDVLQTGKGM
jgi:hypothetical protein